MGFKCTLILVCLAFASANAYYKLIPDGKEVIYDYWALVDAGTQNPTPHGSVFHLNGKLHVQSDGEALMLKFSDMRYKLHNGDVHGEAYESPQLMEAKYLDILPEVEMMEKTFKIMYDTTGKATHMVTETDEPMFIVNMKKALSTIMQMDVEHIHLDQHKPQAFHSKEFTIYGKSKIFYNVYPEGEDMIVTKMGASGDHSHHMNQYLYTNLEFNDCHKTFESPMTHDSQKKYTIAKKDSYHVVDTVEATGGLYFQPFMGKSEGFYVYTNQTMQLESVKPIAEKFTMGTAGHTYNDFTYYMYDMMDATGGIVDITNGRRHYDYPKMMQSVMKKLYEAVDYLEENQIDMKTPKDQKSQMMDVIMQMIMHLNYETLDSMHTMLVQKTGEKDHKALEFFYHFLPHIGTFASGKLIMHMAETTQVKESMMTEMLQEMPLYVRLPNMKYMTEMAHMMELNSESEAIKRYGKICFSILMSKAIDMHDQLYHTHDEHMTKFYWLPEEHQSDKEFPGESAYEKYLIMFTDKLKASTTDKERAMWLSMMYNTKMKLMAKYLIPLMTGEWWSTQSPMVKHSMMHAVFDTVATNPDKVRELFWPVLTDMKEDESVRTVTMYLLMQEATMERLINMYWWMQNETSDTVYGYWYSYMLAMSHSHSPCKEHMRKRLRQVLMYAVPPKFTGIDKFWHVDYEDLHYGFSQELYGGFIDTPGHQTLHMHMTSQMWNMEMEDFVLYFHISGMESSFLEEFELSAEMTNSMFNYDKLMKAFMDIPKNEKLQITVMITKDSYVVKSEVFDHESMKNLGGMLDFWFGKTFNKKMETIHMEYVTYLKQFMPSEMGFPVMLAMLMPHVKSSEMSIQKDASDKMLNFHFDMEMKTWLHTTYTMAFYNPFVDAWQGVSRYQSVDFVYPIYLDASFNPAQQSMKLSWKLHKDHDKNMIGLKMYSNVMTFVDDYIDEHGTTLKASSPDSHHYHSVYLKDDIFHHDHDLYAIGYRHNEADFDTELYVSNGSFSEFYWELMLPFTKHYETPIGYMMGVMSNYRAYLYMDPMPGKVGYMNKLVPSVDNPITNIDLTLRFNKEYKKSEWMLMPGFKYNIRATYAMKNMERAVKTWDLNAMVDMTPGHSLYTWKVYATRIIPEQKDWKICWEGTKKWNMDGSKTHTTLAMSQTADGKCASDDTFVDITAVGERSFAQMHHMHPYYSCQETIWTDMEHEQPFHCYYDVWTMRKYTYNIKMMNMPTEFKNSMMYMFDWFKSWNMRYYKYIEDPHMDKLEDGTMKIELEYPMHEEVMDMSIYTPKHGVNFTAMPMKLWFWWGYHPENLQYPQIFHWMHEMALMDTCEVDPITTIDFDDHRYDDAVTDTWTMYLGDAEKDATKGVWIKMTDTGKMAVKIMFKTHILEIMPMKEDHMFTFILDGKKMMDDSEHRHVEDWFHYYWMKDTGIVTVFCYHLGTHLVFDGHHITFEMPHWGYEWFGHCMHKH